MYEILEYVREYYSNRFPGYETYINESNLLSHIKEIFSEAEEKDRRLEKMKEYMGEI